jgi:hypothetical protein
MTESDKEKAIHLQKCKVFTDWCDKVGIKMPKLEYPAFFDGDLLGVRAKE